MKESQLMAISPVDGRYYEKTEELRDIFSEYGLMKRRVLVEIKWLQALSACDSVPEVPDFSSSIMSRLNNIISNFSLADAEHIKAFEKIK